QASRYLLRHDADVVWLRLRDWPPELDRLPPTWSMRSISASFTEVKVCATLSACSLISSAICTSRSKSVPFESSERRSPTRPSRSSARRSTSFSDAIASPFVRLNRLRRRFPRYSTFTPSEQTPERAQVEVELRVLQPERGLQLLHALLEEHERLSEALDLVVSQRALLHPAERLALHQLAQELDQRQDELRQTAFDLLRVGVDSPREGVADLLERARDPCDVAVRRQQLRLERCADGHAASAKLYGAQGPVQTTVTSGCAEMKPASACSKAGRSSFRTR